MTELWFNPRCGTARKVRAWLDEHGHAYTLREYLKVPLTRDELMAAAQKGGMSARDLLREKEPLARELGLTDPDAPEETIFDALAAHPPLVNRPVVVTKDRACVCRPAERVEAFYA